MDIVTITITIIGDDDATAGGTHSKDGDAGHNAPVLGIGQGALGLGEVAIAAAGDTASTSRRRHDVDPKGGGRCC
jgi:hypothetical protein